VSTQPRMQSAATPAQGKIRCLLAHDHVLLRQGVRRLLEDESDLEVIGEACTVSELLHKINAHRPDVVLLDAGMRGYAASDAARLIKRDHPGVRLIFLGTPPSDEGNVVTLYPHRYLPKDTPAPQLISALRGGKSPAIHAVPAASESVSTVGRLTLREQQVLRLIAEGNTARKVAALLGLSVKTVEVHKFNLMRKLDIHNKAQLVTYAIQNNLVTMSGRG